MRVKFTRSQCIDDIQTTLDYCDLVEEIEKIAERERPLLIETMSSIIVDQCFTHNEVDEVSLTLHKPAALKNGQASLTTLKKR